MKKAQTEPIKTKAKALDLNFPEPKKRKQNSIAIPVARINEQVYYFALSLAHVLGSSKDSAIISADYDQLIHTGGVCLYSLLVQFSGLPPDEIFENM